MENTGVLFFEEDINYTLKEKDKISTWIQNAARSEEFEKIGVVNFIFCSDDYLLEINKKHLNHDTYTDIITFDTSSEGKEISADIFISIERVEENAKNFKVSFLNELHRVMIHGILHLCGYDDSTEKEKLEMRKQENYYLKKLEEMK